MSDTRIGAGSRARATFAHMFRALRHRNFRLFFAGQFVSLTGTWMQIVAQSWLVYRLTGSVMLLGMIGFASQAPVFFLSPLGGAIADRFDRRRLLMVSQAVSMTLAGTLAVLTLTDSIRIWHIFVIAAALGVTNALDIPTRQAFAVDMVGKDDLINAIALNASMFNGARIVGPAIAGVLVATAGEGWCFAANAASYVGVLAGLSLMRITTVKREPKGSTAAHILEGFRYAIATRPVRAILLLLGLVSVTGMPYSVLMPIFADKHLGGGASTLGFLMGASGIGALLAALTLASRRAVFGLGRWVVFACAGLGASLILFSFSRNSWLSAALLIPVGFSMMTQMSSSNTLVQSMVPDELRGRVMAVYSMMFMGMAPLGAIFAGTVAGYIGAPFTVAIGGSVCLAAAIYVWLRFAHLEREGREMIIALQMTGGDPASKASFQEPALRPRAD